MRTPGWLSACVVNFSAPLHGSGGVAFNELRHDTTCGLQTSERRSDVQERRVLRLRRPFASEEDHHDELRLAQPFPGNKVALVGLLHVFREAELSALPEPAPKAPEKAHVLHRSRREGPHPPTLSHDPRKCARTHDKPTDSDAAPAENAQCTGGSKSNFPPHGALGGFALKTATLVASTPTNTSGVGQLGDGGRGATKRRGEAVCVKESVPFVIGVGRRLRGTGGLGGRGEGCRGPGGVDRWLRTD